MLKFCVGNQCTQIHNKTPQLTFLYHFNKHLHTLTPCVTFLCGEASLCRFCYQRVPPHLVVVVLAELISNIQQYVL